MVRKKTSARPLAGVRVLDFSRHMPGPYSSAILADLGADVIKIEEPGIGDPTRGLPPAIPDGSDSAVHAWLNRGKRSVAVDLKSTAGRAIALSLAKKSDIVIETFRTGVARRLGIDFASIRRVNPHVIFLTISGYGSNGPYAGRASHDLNAQGLAGLVGEDGAMPQTLAADTAAGLFGALQTVAALHVPRGKRRAVVIDVSMYDAAMGLMGLPLQRALMTGKAFSGLRGDYACYRNYRCRDGRFMTVGALEPEFWSEVCATLGFPEYGAFQWNEARQPKIMKDIEGVFLTKDRADWERVFARKDVCVEAVLSLDEVLSSSLARARHAFGKQRARRGTFASPLLPGMPRALRERAPLLGEHTNAILKSLRYSTSRISKLRAQGVVA